MVTKNCTVLGIDPGSRHTGWGIVHERSGVLSLGACGVINPPTKGAFAARLAFIFHELHALLLFHTVDEVAVEDVFIAKNVATAMKLGQARGAAIAACASHNLPVFDYSPRLIKQSVSGSGAASKDQVSFMVARLLNTKATWAVDAGDALAVSICHLTQRRFARLTA